MSKSRTKKRVIIIIISQYKNDILLKYKFEWKTIIDIMNIQKDVNWVKIIIYDINIITFNGDNDMKLLKF